jgi:hypothetical protein
MFLYGLKKNTLSILALEQIRAMRKAVHRKSLLQAVQRLYSSLTEISNRVSKPMQCTA